MRIEAGQTAYFENFSARLVVDELSKKPIPSPTATHEARHVVGAIMNGTSVESVSIIPGPGYSGITKLAKPDAIAAMAPHSMGSSGTSYDVYIAGLIGNAGAAESAARSIIMSNEEKVEAVAVVLEEKKSLASHDIKKALYEVENPLPRSGTIFIENSDGEVKKERVEVRDNIILLPDSLLNAFPSKNRPN